MAILQRLMTHYDLDRPIAAIGSARRWCLALARRAHLEGRTSRMPSSGAAWVAIPLADPK
jgi:hypothetical protein